MRISATRGIPSVPDHWFDRSGLDDPIEVPAQAAVDALAGLLLSDEEMVVLASATKLLDYDTVMNAPAPVIGVDRGDDEGDER